MLLSFCLCLPCLRRRSLINPKDTDTALLAVECALRSSGFSFRSAGILSGRDEGIYGWLSTNYLLGRLPPPVSVPSVVILFGELNTLLSHRSLTLYPCLSGSLARFKRFSTFKSRNTGALIQIDLSSLSFNMPDRFSHEFFIKAPSLV